MRKCFGEYFAAANFAAAILLAGCGRNLESASERFNELPPAVQKTVRAEVPNGEIQGVSHSAKDGANLYTIEFRENGRKGRMVVAGNGDLLSDKERDREGVNSRALTPTGPVGEAARNYNSATSINKNALEPTGVGTPFSALPLAAQQTIQAQAPGLQIATISRHEEMGRIIYSVEFTDKGKNPTMRVAEDGALVQALRK
jgi:uncharacterized membrane protein YkoI